jgi:hypothetical protein
MLVKLSTGVDFTNILKAAFAHKDPKIPKRHKSLGCLFVLLGSSRIKFARKHVSEIVYRITLWFAEDNITRQFCTENASLMKIMHGYLNFL